MKQALIIGLFALLAIVGLACGGTAPTPTPTPTSTPTPTPTPTPTSTPTPTPTPTPPRPSPDCENPTLEISVNGDAFEFDTDRFEVAAGAEVVPCFKNVSSGSPHNRVLVKDGTKDEVAERGLKAGPENGWLQLGDPDVIANVKLLGPGQEGEVRFTAPTAGTYQFVCTFPGHNAHGGLHQPVRPLDRPARLMRVTAWFFYSITVDAQDPGLTKKRGIWTAATLY